MFYFLKNGNGKKGQSEIFITQKGPIYNSTFGKKGQSEIFITQKGPIYNKTFGNKIEVKKGKINKKVVISLL